MATDCRNSLSASAKLHRGRAARQRVVLQTATSTPGARRRGTCGSPAGSPSRRRLRRDQTALASNPRAPARSQRDAPGDRRATSTSPSASLVQRQRATTRSAARWPASSRRSKLQHAEREVAQSPLPEPYPSSSVTTPEVLVEQRLGGARDRRPASRAGARGCGCGRAATGSPAVASRWSSGTAAYIQRLRLRVVAAVVARLRVGIEKAAQAAQRIQDARELRLLPSLRYRRAACDVL